MSGAPARAALLPDMAKRPQLNFPEADLAADRQRALAMVSVSRETLARLDRFVELLLEQQKITNLIAASTVPIIWTRHIVDSLQLLALIPHAKRWIDLGSGAGFPGLMIACALADTADAAVHLVESNAKKAAFLREAALELGVPATIYPVRIEDFVQNFHERIDAVTARALAPLDDLLKLAFPLLKTGAQGLFLKGQDVATELTKAGKSWSMDFALVPSKTNAESRIVVVRGLKKRTDKN